MVLEKKIFKSCQFIFIFSQLSLHWEGHGPWIEQIWLPFTRGYFVPSLVEVGPVVLEEKIFQSFQWNFTISQFFPFEKDMVFIWPNLNSHYPGMLCAKFGWNWPNGSGEEYVKSVRTDGRTDGRTDRHGRWTTDDQESSLELKTQLSNISSPTVLFPLTQHFITKRMLQCSW